MPPRRQTRRTDNPPAPVIPAKAGIQDLSDIDTYHYIEPMDSRFRGNDGIVGIMTA